MFYFKSYMVLSMNPVDLPCGIMELIVFDAKYSSSAFMIQLRFFVFHNGIFMLTNWSIRDMYIEQKSSMNCCMLSVEFDWFFTVYVSSLWVLTLSLNTKLFQWKDHSKWPDQTAELPILCRQSPATDWRALLWCHIHVTFWTLLVNVVRHCQSLSVCSTSVQWCGNWTTYNQSQQPHPY